MDDSTAQISFFTSWLRNENDMVAARIALLLRQKSINVKSMLCAKIFPNTKIPQFGIIVTPDKKVYQFAYNKAGMEDHLAKFDEWIDISAQYMRHQWRDEILTALTMFQD